MSEPLTIKTAIERSSSWLRDRGSGSPRLDVELLLAEVLGVDRMGLYVQAQRPLSDAEQEMLRGLLQRRAQHEPIDYILGTTEFWTLTLKSDKRALVPRNETELLVDTVVKAARKPRDYPLRIVDVGTGTCALALALASEFPQAQVVAVDISEEALALARENTELLGLQDRVHLVLGDLLEPLIRKGSKADVIVSNPPYVGERERHLMDPGVEKWEPVDALFAGDDGMAVIDTLLAQVPKVLDRGGIFVMEFGSPQGELIRERAQKKFRRWEIRKDYSGHDRALVVHGPGERSWGVTGAMAPERREEELGSADTSPVVATQGGGESDPLLSAPTTAETLEERVAAGTLSLEDAADALNNQVAQGEISFEEAQRVLLRLETRVLGTKDDEPLPEIDLNEE